MDRILFMTVGTGVGDNEEQIHSLAHGLLKSITHFRPDKILFFGSNLSMKTVESLKNQYKDQNNEELENYEFIEFKDVDNFDSCFRIIKEKIEENQGHEIIIDYTSGTKTMTTSAAICSVLYRKDLTLVSGRGQNGLVMSQTENIKTQSLYSVYDEMNMEKVKESFNGYRFETAHEILDEIISLEDKEVYQSLIMAYSLWDKFNHKEASDILSKLELDFEGDGSFKLNKKFIGTLVKTPNMRDKHLIGPYLVADLIKNAERRLEEGKYDDAVARLYRAVELIVQCKLKFQYGVETSDLDVEKLPEEIRYKYENKRGRNGKIMIGMRQSYKLIRDLNDDLGDKFHNDSRLKDLLQQRNNSILAHGLQPITKGKASEVVELKDKTVELAKSLYQNIEKLMKEAEFARLN